MRDEARNTTSHQSTWGQNANLRNKPVAFVSAGVIEPLKDMKTLHPPGETASKPHEPHAEEASEPQLDTVEDCPSNSLESADVAIRVEQTSSTAELRTNKQPCNADGNIDAADGSTMSSSAFFFDLCGDKSTRQSPHAAREISRPQLSPDELDSGEEIILFRGRSQKFRVGMQKKERIPISAKQTGPPAEDPRAVNSKNSKSSKSRKGRHSLCRARRGSTISEDPDQDIEDEILADYIANMAAQSEDTSTDNQPKPFSTQRDLGGQHDAFGFESAPHDTSGDEEGGTSDSDASDINGEGLLKEAGFAGETRASDDEALNFDSDMDEDLFVQLLSERQRSEAATKTMIEALDDLDLAGWDQPAVSRRGKGRRRKQPPAFNLSDSEIETALRTAWAKDRERKKNRKMEREALRAADILGKNVNPGDLRVKYQSGMRLEEITHELVVFILGSGES